MDSRRFKPLDAILAQIGASPVEVREAHFDAKGNILKLVFGGRPVIDTTAKAVKTEHTPIDTAEAHARAKRKPSAIDSIGVVDKTFGELPDDPKVASDGN